MHRLAGGGSDIGHDAIAVLEAAFRCDCAECGKERGKQRGVLG